MEKPFIRIAAGIVVSNTIAIILFVVTKIVLFIHDQTGAVLITSNFVTVPVFMGIISGFIWQPLRYAYWRFVLLSLVSGSLAILSAAIFMQEGVICLLIVSPLIFVVTILANFLTIFLINHNKNHLNVSLIGLLIVLFAADLIVPHEFQNSVSDQIVIGAPPEKIWPHVVAFAPIEAPSEFWLFDIGLPRPVETTVEGNYAGAARKCIFSSGAVFEERMSVFKPHEDLTFDITAQPKDPEIIGHIELIRGRFLLHDNGDGTTTLTGTSWYDLKVFPAWYYDLWAEAITRNVHLRVMKHIKNLSE